MNTIEDRRSSEWTKERERERERIIGKENEKQSEGFSSLPSFLFFSSFSLVSSCISQFACNLFCGRIDIGRSTIDELLAFRTITIQYRESVPSYRNVRFT